MFAAELPSNSYKKTKKWYVVFHGWYVKTYIKCVVVWMCECNTLARNRKSFTSPHFFRIIFQLLSVTLIVRNLKISEFVRLKNRSVNIKRYERGFNLTNSVIVRFLCHLRPKTWKLAIEQSQFSSSESIGKLWVRLKPQVEASFSRGFNLTFKIFLYFGRGYFLQPSNNNYIVLSKMYKK